MTTEKVLTTEYAAQLIYQSFRLSQGNATLQGQYFIYIHEQHSSWRVSDSEKEGVESALLGASYTHVLSGNHSKLNSDHEQVIKQVKHQLYHETINFQRALAGELGTDPHFLPYNIGTIARGLIFRDYRLLYGNGGRNRIHPNPNRFSDDPFSSYFRQYVLEGQNTGLEEYDQMFGDIKEFLLNTAGKDDWLIKRDDSSMSGLERRDNVKPGSALFWIARVWEQHHPRERYFRNTLPTIE